MLDLVFKNSTSERYPAEGFFKGILIQGLKELEFDEYDVEVSVNLVGEDKIRVLNKKYRNKDKVTDVLSFPLEEKQMGKLLLGDIFICLPFAKKQAKSENISIEDKLAQLTVHGFLHLNGYDHEGSKEDAQKMFKLEKKILDKLMKL